MSEPQQSVWSTNSEKALDAEFEIEENKVMVSTPDGILVQKTFDVPVYSDSKKIPLPVFQIDIKKVSYNFDNIRIWKYKSRLMNELDVDRLDPENDDHQKAVKEILLNTKSYSNIKVADLKEDIVKNEQDDPALVTKVGVLWNGNRRCAILHDIFENGFSGKEVSAEAGDGKWLRIKVVKLPDLNPQQLRDLEKRLQQRPETKEPYGEINQMGDIRDFIDRYDFEVDYKTPTDTEKQEVLNEFKHTDYNSWSKLSDAKSCIDLIDEYLEDLGRVGHYDIVEEGEGGVTTFMNIVNLLKKVETKFEDDDEKYEAYKAMILTAVKSKGKLAHGRIRDITNVINKDSSEGETNTLLDELETNSTILSNWNEYANNPEKLNDVDLQEAEQRNIESVSHTYNALRFDPKTIIENITKELNNINTNLIPKNDPEFLDNIKKIKTKLDDFASVSIE